MATTIEHLTFWKRTAAQKTCIGMGVVFFLAGAVGFVSPGILGTHLSLMHNLVHFVTGAFSLWIGLGDRPRSAYRFSMGFGTLYGLLGVFGFVLGTPGMPIVGQLYEDQNLWRIIPGVFELGTNDHLLHIVIGGVYLIADYLSTTVRGETPR